MLKPMPAAALTIAGSDPSGGAGIQADLKTFHQFGVYGEAAITLITVQNSVRLSRVEILRAELVREQIAAVLEDIPPSAAKTGALGSVEIVEAVADMAATFAFSLSRRSGNDRQARSAAAGGGRSARLARAADPARGGDYAQSSRGRSAHGHSGDSAFRCAPHRGALCAKWGLARPS